MTRLEILAIRALPEEYVADGTVIGVSRTNPADQNFSIVALNPALLPIVWREANGWAPIGSPRIFMPRANQRVEMSEQQDPEKFDVLPNS